MMFKWTKKLWNSFGTPEFMAGDKQEAVLVHLNEARVCAELFDDLAELEDQLEQSLGEYCEVDGHDVGADGATIYCYGNDAEVMFACIRPVLQESSFWPAVSATLRYGPPGSAERTVRLVA